MKLLASKEQFDGHTIDALLQLKKKASNEKNKAMNNLLKGYASNFVANHKNFKMKFHSKKDSQQSIAILSKHWGKSRGEFSFLYKINSAESLPKQLEYDSCLVINRLGKFYLCISEPLKIRAENQGPLFSENQEKGKNDISQIYRLCHIDDRLQSKRDKIHGKGNKRKRYRMIKRGQRRIGSKTARAMCRFKVFCCSKCKTELDRDINGACNILLHYLTKKNESA
ncbi:6504_t:CDS:2 [Racocetra persica]|uniref:6504_t:CDS:1 n=1 Tax=Racocetra persica TaxID=160502 RepID=A0ACA9LXW2_9GLOM|nr:6504_t:CDS:2 [Racocetra persica]